MTGSSHGVWGGVRWCLGGVLDTFSDPGALAPPRPPPGHTGIQDPGSDRVKGTIVFSLYQCYYLLNITYF